MRLLLATIAAMLGLLMLVGSITEATRTRPAKIEYRPAPPRPSLERMPGVRRIDCERVEDLVGMTAICA